VAASLAIHLRDLGQPLVDAWRQEFADVPSVQISCGDIFSTQPGPIRAGASIDVKADAIISPANSFGFMDGGIDLLYTYQFGEALQRRVQDAIRRDFHGELPVGSAVIVPTGHQDIPWCVAAPTMRIPGDVADTVHAYLAFRAALHAVLAHTSSGLPRIETVLCPGLATAIGRMPVARCARQMRRAFDRVLGGEEWMPGSVRAAVDDDSDLRR